MAAITTTQLYQALQAAPEIAQKAAWQAAQIQSQPPTEIVVIYYSKTYQPLGEIANYISLECEFPRNDMGTATIVVQGGDPCVPTMFNATTTTIPITIQVGANMRWSGRVNSYAYALDDQNYTMTLECVDDYTYLSRMLVWPNYLLPIEVQFPTNAIFLGPAVTCILSMVAEAAFRLQSGMWTMLDNALSGDEDWTAWFGQLLNSNGNVQDMLLTPIVVMFVDPIYDTSPWIAITGRMDKISTLIKDTLMDYGLALTCNLWLPGDPQPGTTSNMGASWIPLEVDLTVPTIVVQCVDRSGVTGPTGTFIDGLVEDVVDLQNSVLGNVLAPFLNPDNEYYPTSLGINIAPALGVNFIPSWVIFNGDVPNNGLENFKLTGYHPIAYQIIGGGKSPQWLDDLINATLEFLIDAIEITVGFTGIPDTLLDGTFDDILLAFQMQGNGQRQIDLGPYGFQEYFTHTGASAYTLDEWFALFQAMYDTMGYNCIQLTFIDGEPYTVGMDVFVGQLVSFVLNGQLYTDYVYSVKVKDDRQTRAKIDVVVGDGKREVNPILRTVRMLTGVEEVLNVITLSSGSSQ